jgi:hypothetical protein
MNDEPWIIGAIDWNKMYSSGPEAAFFAGFPCKKRSDWTGELSKATRFESLVAAEMTLQKILERCDVLDLFGHDDDQIQDCGAFTEYNFYIEQRATETDDGASYGYKNGERGYVWHLPKLALRPHAERNC